MNKLAAGAVKNIVLVGSLVVNLLMAVMLVVLEDDLHLIQRAVSLLHFKVPDALVHKYVDLEYHRLDSGTFSIDGVPFYRAGLPVDRLGAVHGKIRGALMPLGRMTSGVRVRFRTDSDVVHVRLRSIRYTGFSQPSMSELASSGIDIYADGVYIETLSIGNHDHLVILGNRENRKTRSVELYLPTLSPIDLLSVGMRRGSMLDHPPAYRRTIAFYGTSIVQGISASRPSLTLPAVIARRFDSDYYNLGFAGHGQGDPVIAELLGRLRADLYILMYGRQAVGDVRNNVLQFCRLIREHARSAPILLVTDIYDAQERYGALDLEAKRTAMREAYRELKLHDSGVFLIEGAALLGPSDLDGYADTTHPSSLGYRMMADRLEPILRKLLPGA